MLPGHVPLTASHPGIMLSQRAPVFLLESDPIIIQVKREAAKRRILHRVSEAYGRMILCEGLFQVLGGSYVGPRRNLVRI